MIILDWSEYKGKRHPTWPDNMPTKIRLAKGKFDRDYDIHPMVLSTLWYRELYKRCKKFFPYHNHNLPIGFNDRDLKEGVRIIKDD